MPSWWVLRPQRKVWDEPRAEPSIHSCSPGEPPHAAGDAPAQPGSGPDRHGPAGLPARVPRAAWPGAGQVPAAQARGRSPGARPDRQEEPAGEEEPAARKGEMMSIWDGTTCPNCKSPRTDNRWYEHEGKIVYRCEECRHS